MWQRDHKIKVVCVSHISSRASLTGNALLLLTLRKYLAEIWGNKTFSGLSSALCWISCITPWHQLNAKCRMSISYSVLNQICALLLMWPTKCIACMYLFMSKQRANYLAPVSFNNGFVANVVPLFSTAIRTQPHGGASEEGKERCSIFKISLCVD